MAAFAAMMIWVLSVETADLALARASHRLSVLLRFCFDFVATLARHSVGWRQRLEVL